MDRPPKEMGSLCAVIGAQWGDEGKGKIVDLLTPHFSVLARACGGANAGHTVVIGGRKHVFHLLPSGCLHGGTSIVLGAGMVVHLETLLGEIRALEDAGIAIVNRLSLAGEAHILFEYHKTKDALDEERRAKREGQSIGTTRRGIGPAYAEKALRSGLRLEALRWEEAALRADLAKRSERLRLEEGILMNFEQELAALLTARSLLADRIVMPVASLMHEYIESGRTVLIEGAQATLLDIDHGSYPHVTSSATTAAGALQGLGIPPRALGSCIGVAKAYCTRVGAGRFLTEADPAAAGRLRERGGEYGSTTGRPRRCGWMALPDLRFAARVSGFTSWNITKLDVLDEEPEIPVCVEVVRGEARMRSFPGWNASTRGITEFSALPKEARSLLECIERETGVPVGFIGTGPDRADMIVRDPLPSGVSS